MTVGAMAVFEGKIPFKRFMKTINSRLHLVPRYRQIVLDAPFNVGMPTWEDDPEFDIANHISEITLEKPGTEAQLRELSQELFEGRLPRDRPLWELYVVKGLEGGRTGLVARVHHAMIDGVAGVGLMMILFDTVPNPVPIRKKPYRPAPLPDQASLLQDALWDNAIEGIQHWTQFQKTFVNFARDRSGDDVLESFKHFGSALKDLVSPRHKFSFNKRFSGERAIAFGEASFAEARAIRAECGGTINDVALTVLTGALRKYLKNEGEYLEGKTVSVVCPVNVRAETDSGSLGNQISFLPVNVPLDIDDPVELLNTISSTTATLKGAKVAELVGMLFSMLQGMPAPLQRLALASAVTETGQSVMQLIPQLPPGNLICTNVPGPQIPLYTCGKRLSKYYPLLPVVLEMGISLGITSYNQRLYFTYMADGNCAPDIAKVADYHVEAFNELRDAAQVRPRDRIAIHETGRPQSNGKTREQIRVRRTPVPKKESAIQDSAIGGGAESVTRPTQRT